MPLTEQTTGNMAASVFIRSSSLWLLLALGGCASAETIQNKPNVQQRAGRIFLVRGILTPVCLGVDKLARDLQAKGLAASVHSHVQAGEIARTIERKHAEGNREPLVLIGYSTGCGTVQSIARRLQCSNIPVDLLITIDPLPIQIAPIPANVRKGLNYYHRHVPGVLLLSGRAMTAENPQVTSLINVDFTRSEMREPFLNHFTMDEQPAITLAILNAALENCPPEPVHQ
jgi:hypothetical protein